MPVGYPQYADVNRRLNQLLAKPRPLVATHRGTGLGSIAENTVAAVRAALRQGSDIVEIDVVESSDGVHYVFHDGYEQMAFGDDTPLTRLPSAQVEERVYKWCAPAGYGVDRLDRLLDALPDVFFNIDRSWRYWPGVLDLMAHRGPERLLLKSTCVPEALEALAAHPVKFPFAPIVRTTAEIDLVRAIPEINTVGFELIASSPASPLADREFIAGLRHDGYLALLNAIVLENRDPLFAGWDDEVSVLEDPDSGWGRLERLGADIIQTDWPGLLTDYLEETSGARARLD